jgi:hypothetical protein
MPRRKTSPSQGNAGPPQVSLSPTGSGLGAARPWRRSPPAADDDEAPAIVPGPLIRGRLCVLESVLSPGADTGDRSIVEHLEQAVYVLQGRLTIWVDGEERTLKPGDAVQLPSGVPTRCAHLSRQVTRTLWMYC